MKGLPMKDHQSPFVILSLNRESAASEPPKTAHVFVKVLAKVFPISFMVVYVTKEIRKQTLDMILENMVQRNAPVGQLGLIVMSVKCFSKPPPVSQAMSRGFHFFNREAASSSHSN